MSRPHRVRREIRQSGPIHPQIAHRLAGLHRLPAPAQQSLSIQQTRLDRQRQRDLAALDKLQEKRKEVRRRQIEDARNLFDVAEKTNEIVHLADFGFEISEADLLRQDSWSKHRKQGYNDANAWRMVNRAA